MSDQKRLRLAFGGFDCEIRGFDDPEATLGRLLALYADAAAARPEIRAAGGPDPSVLGARFAAMAAARSGEIGGEVEAAAGRVTVSRAPGAEVERRMSPEFLSEYVATRARLRAEEAAAPRRATLGGATLGGATRAAPPTGRPRVRVVRHAPPLAAAVGSGPVDSRPPIRLDAADNFHFAVAPTAPAAAAEMQPIAAPARSEATPLHPSEPRGATSRFGFLGRAVPPELSREAGEGPVPGEDAAFRRLAEAAAAALPRARTAAAAAEPDAEVGATIEAPRSGAERAGAAAFAAGARSLAELAEAAAAWLALVEGRARFDRRDAMRALAAAAEGRDVPPEARLRAFRLSLKSGALVRGADGLYALSAEAFARHAGGAGAGSAVGVGPSDPAEDEAERQRPEDA